MGVTSLIVYHGIQGGIEKVSRLIMPVLFVLIIVIALFSLTLSHSSEDGITRTGLQGLQFYLTPNLQGLTVRRFLQILLDAMSQLFFSLSVSMGIMITYGSYVKPDVNLNQSVNQIEFFDTAVAFLSGMMIIPAVYVFSGTEGMSAGPGLMFISLPKIFHEMGKAGIVVGVIFFLAAAFATLTSCISVLESIVANCIEIFYAPREKVTILLTVIYMVISAVIALGYSVFYVEITLPNDTVGQLLDIMDYISNSVMMPFISFFSCILIGWIMGSKWISDEMESSGHRFKRKSVYQIMIKYIAPVLMLLLAGQSIGVWNVILN